MAQETGTQILARARIFAQDNDANGNYAVGAADALILLNDVLVSLSNNVKTKPKWMGASVSGLTFSAGEESHLSGTGMNIVTEIESFHQAASSTLAFPVSPPIERVSVPDILEMFRYDGNNALAQAASEWTHVAAEKSQTDTAASGVEKWRVWAFPVINTTRSLHIRYPAPVTISAIGDYPDIDTVDSRLISRLLAYEIAKLKKESSPEFLAGILAPVPKEILQQAYGGAVRSSQLYDHVAQRNP